jgi:hypothetical protein
VHGKGAPDRDRGTRGGGAARGGRGGTAATAPVCTFEDPDFNAGGHELEIDSVTVSREPGGLVTSPSIPAGLGLVVLGVLAAGAVVGGAGWSHERLRKRREPTQPV